MFSTLHIREIGYNMDMIIVKKAIIKISLVPESEKASNEGIEVDIKQTLKCSWLAEIEKVTVKSKTKATV